MIAEHKAYLKKMDTDREAAKISMIEHAEEEAIAKQDAFDKELAMSEQAIQSRKALAQYRIFAIRKETFDAIKKKEHAWQLTARTWLGKAVPKVEVKAQQDAEAQ